MPWGSVMRTALGGVRFLPGISGSHQLNQVSVRPTYSPGWIASRLETGYAVSGKISGGRGRRLFTCRGPPSLTSRTRGLPSSRQSCLPLFRSAITAIPPPLPYDAKSTWPCTARSAALHGVEAGARSASSDGCARRPGDDRTVEPASSRPSATAQQNERSHERERELGAHRRAL